MKVAFYTLGCKVNQYETDLMIENFRKNNYEIVDFLEKADIYVINSCSVTTVATRKTRQMLSRAKKKNGIVVLCGCYAQEIEDQKIDNADIVVGNEEKKDVVKIVEEYISKNSKKNIVYKVANISNIKKFSQTDLLEKGINIRESLKIEDGCNNFCSYCIIPYLRGRVRSKDISKIEEETKNLVKSGVKEIVVVGIEIASYGKDLEDDINLVDVIEKVSKIDGLERIRLGSIEPRILTTENIIRLSKIKKLCNHFHISVQSLNNDVLKAMNRHYTVEDLFNITDKLKEYFENPALTCDIIVGFPGETEDMFNETLKNAEKIGFYEVHTFKYSKRKWTRAANMENQVDGNEKNRRSGELINLAKSLKLKYMSCYLNTKQEVLIEEYKDGYLYGYTKNYIKVKIRGDKKLWGCLLMIELNSINEDLILGDICV